MANTINYSKIEESLKQMRCPECGSDPKRIELGTGIIGFELKCDHNFEDTLFKEYQKQKNEQLGAVLITD
jgi:hypothetical protein